MKRRDFIRHSAVAAAGLTVLPRPELLHGVLSPAAHGPVVQDAARRELAARALEAARSAGADWADVRINTNRNQGISTRERRITGVSDNVTSGFGVRVLVDGTWGFAASGNVTNDEVVRVARQAVAQARANRAAQREPVRLAPADVEPNGVWRSPIRTDPFEIPIEEKVEYLFAANEAALAVSGSRFVNSSMFFLREDKFFGNTEGTFTDQTIYRAYPRMNVSRRWRRTARTSSRAPRRTSRPGLGYEHVRTPTWSATPRWAEEAVEKLSARSVEPGALRPGAAADPPVAHAARVHRASDGARPDHGLRGQLRGHLVHLPARGLPGDVPLRPRVHERPGRALHARARCPPSGGTTRASAATTTTSSRRHAQRPADDARAGAVAGRLVRAARAARCARTATRTRSPGPTCSSSACRTSTCCRIPTATSRSRS
jgi:hypothetical protein